MTRTAVVSTAAFVCLFSCAAVFARSSNGMAVAPPSPIVQTSVSEAYGRLPLSFEANQGQSDPAVRFLARGEGYALFLADTEAVLKVRPAAHERFTPNAVVRMWLARANRHPRITGAGLHAGKSNYFIGRDPAKWRRDVPNYGSVRYAEVYPGIDLVFRGNQRQLEYDFVVAPGADPKRIELVFDGIEKVSIDGGGNLVLVTAGGKIVQHKPVVYQEIIGQRREIEGQYVLRGKRRASFHVGSYDATRELVIDPVLVYSTYLGGTGDEEATAVAVDDSGSAYITGTTSSADFPTTANAFQTLTSGGYSGDIFVTKLNPAGSALVYSTYLGGVDLTGEYATALAIDSSGNAYITGLSDAYTFPTTAGAYQTHPRGSKDAFVTKLNPDGNALVYSTFLGGTGSDSGNAIAVDSSGNAYVTGHAACDPGPQLVNNFPTTAGAFKTFIDVCDAIFVAKFNATGTALEYSTYLGSGGGQAIAVDAVGNAYVAGYTPIGGDHPVPTTPGAFRTTGGVNAWIDAFVTKLNPSGSGLVYSTYIGGDNPGGYGGDYAYGIAVDSSGNAYVAGKTSSQNFPTTAGALQTTFVDAWYDGFVTKLNPSGSALVYSTYLAGANNSGEGTSVNGIAIDGSGNAYLTGTTLSFSFPTVGAIQASIGSTQGAEDSFVSKLSPSGSALVYSTYLGGDIHDKANGIAVDRNGNAYIVGRTTSDNFPLVNPLQSVYRGGPGSATGDAFLTKISPAALVTVTSSVNPSNPAQSVTFTATVSQANSPAGTVQFMDGAATFGAPIALSGGAATYTTSALTSGSHSISAVYSGDSNNAANTSAVFSQKVRVATTTTVTSSLNPSTYLQPVTLTATVVPNVVAGTIPTGTVQFKDGAAFLYSPGTLSSGAASITVSNLVPGTHSITAEYSGDADNAPNTSAPLVQTVTGSGSPVTITNISPRTGPVGGGTNVTITGTAFRGSGMAFATVTFGGVSATNVTVVSSTTITATTPAHAAGTVDVSVMNSDGQSGVLASGFTFQTVPNGDANGDGQVTVSDVFYLINHLFASGPAAIAGDANGDGIVTVADVFYLINYLFAGGPPPK
jgi:Bacterial Ig-like domain (group 3)/IPT/TIG domain/Beta-propeller repeat/Dockerin type I domain